MAIEATAAMIVVVAIRRLPSPTHVSASVRLMLGPSSSYSSAAMAAGTGGLRSSLFMAFFGSERVDGGDADAEAGEDLCKVLEVAHERAAPGLEVQLVRNDECVAGLHDLRFEA